MNTSSYKTYRRLGLGWTAYSLLAYLSGIGLFMAGLGRLVNNVGPFLFGVTLGGVMGSLSGLAQFLILKKVIPTLQGWPLLSCLGWMSFWSLNMVGAFGRGYDLKTKLLEGLIHGLVFGLILGTFQWLAIRKTGRQSIYWILANALIWPLCALLADGCKLVFHLQGPAEFLIALPLSAILTGIAISFFIPVLPK